jgi:hypothetical protein
MLSPELSRRLGRLGNTPYMKVVPGLMQNLMRVFSQVQTESELSEEVKKVVELCDLSGEVAVRDFLDDDFEAVSRMMSELREQGRYHEFFTETPVEYAETTDEPV